MALEANKIDVNSLSSEKLKKALTYLLNHQEGLKVFLEDPEIPADNNRVERGFIPIARGRHNWMFAFSQEGAASIATMFSIIQTARENHLNVYQYLVYFMDQLKPYVDTGRAIPTEALERLLPWNNQVQAECQKSTSLQNTTLLCDAEHA